MAKHKAKRKRIVRTSSTQQHMVPAEAMSVTGEARYIIERACQRDARSVTLGPLVFFSTDMGDAWMLDPEDGFALCLARDGVPQPYNIQEADTSFAIEWNADYRIEGDAFVVATRSGQVRSILGYPVGAIQEACRRCTQMMHNRV